VEWKNIRTKEKFREARKKKRNVRKNGGRRERR
jgi:hypothetical protein